MKSNSTEWQVAGSRTAKRREQRRNNPMRIYTQGLGKCRYRYQVIQHFNQFAAQYGGSVKVPMAIYQKTFMKISRLKHSGQYNLQPLMIGFVAALEKADASNHSKLHRELVDIITALRRSFFVVPGSTCKDIADKLAFTQSINDQDFTNQLLMAASIKVPIDKALSSVKDHFKAESFAADEMANLLYTCVLHDANHPKRPIDSDIIETLFKITEMKYKRQRKIDDLHNYTHHVLLATTFYQHKLPTKMQKELESHAEAKQDTTESKCQQALSRFLKEHYSNVEDEALTAGALRGDIVVRMKDADGNIKSACVEFDGTQGHSHLSLDGTPNTRCLSAKDIASDAARKKEDIHTVRINFRKLITDKQGQQRIVDQKASQPALMTLERELKQVGIKPHTTMTLPTQTTSAPTHKTQRNSPVHGNRRRGSQSQRQRRNHGQRYYSQHRNQTMWASRRDSTYTTWRPPAKPTQSAPPGLSPSPQAS